MIPIVIVCFNNHKYVENTVRQITAKNPSYADTILIMDNASTDPDTRAYLDATPRKVVRNQVNHGPWLNHFYNADVFKSLPERYILTDADLELNKAMPENFIDHLVEVMNYTGAWIVGVALKRDDCDLPYAGKSVFEYEQQFWQARIPHPTYELYNAGVDTTFALRDHRGSPLSVRVAGDFTARHLPWYKEDGVMTIADKYALYSSCNPRISVAANIILEHINANYSIVKKHDETIVIKKNEGPNYNFWLEHFPTWEDELFVLFDRFLRKDKVCIDIGGWIGLTCIYASRKSKHVYVVEADPGSVKELKQNCSHNCDNVTIIDKAIAVKSGETVFMGKNKHISSAVLNDSTSQAYDTPVDGSYAVTTISIDSLLPEYSISLIKVDIEGGEEDILEDLYRVHKSTNAPLFVSFHLCWWKDQNLDRFSFLTNDQKHSIRCNPFHSVLFE